MKRMTRRRFLRYGLGAGAGLALPWGRIPLAWAASGPKLAKYIQPLPLPDRGIVVATPSGEELNASARAGYTTVCQYMENVSAHAQPVHREVLEADHNGDAPRVRSNSDRAIARSSDPDGRRSPFEDRVVRECEKCPQPNPPCTVLARDSSHPSF
jgi:hypothetical protein